MIPTVDLPLADGSGAPPPHPPQSQTDPSGERRDPARLTGIVIASPPEMPANELSVRFWLDDRLQWVQDERQTASVLALSSSAVVIGYRGRDPGQGPPLTVHGTLAAGGLTVSGADGAPVQIKGLPSRTAVRDRPLCALFIDPETGQLYIG